MRFQFEQGNCEDIWNVLLWCSMPIPFDDCDSLICDYLDEMDPSISGMSGSPSRINFWYFLFFYYGVYNAIALLMIAKMFSIYALRWYPTLLGSKVTFVLFWIGSQGIGILFFYLSPVKDDSIFWVILTFATMAMPVIGAFMIIHQKRKHQPNKRLIRYLVTDTQQRYNISFAKPAQAIAIKRKAPASYRRFLWFCTALVIALLSFIGAEMYAYLFLSTLPHTPLDAFLYVYSLVGAVYILDAITDYIIYRKIRSHPLTICNCPVRILLVDKIGRSFYYRNLAENTTMLAFLCWLNILHFGPNRAAYPYFHMDDRDGSPYNHQRTFIASLIIWTSELTSAYITRRTFKKYFNHSVTKQAVLEFEKYPEMIVGFIIVMIHVLQNILLALIKLDFDAD
ncbi:hypothetical protein BDB01DRAFT_714710 [Pilobolus umbonatus]|nr:hypothetical protein BDB01DRAFT_714710 [Pilobolus umbonatus]